jgi:hypothetical protein
VLCREVYPPQIGPELGIFLEDLGEAGVAFEFGGGGLVVGGWWCEVVFVGRRGWVFVGLIVLIVLVDVGFEAWDGATARC